ncbi:MAG: DUF5320 domain-containing protein [Firmicutes bacterium]|nr:DUF5320 domain-containing protein [Bacillota bacterium]
MPGGDGTGPLGQGPLSGRGLGYCSGYRGAGFGRPFYGRRFRGYGFQRPWLYRETADDEKMFLQRQAEYMREQIEAIEERLKEIDAPEAEE